MNKQNVKIGNFSLQQIKNKEYKIDNKTVLISILDPDMETPLFDKDDFECIIPFKFWDNIDDDFENFRKELRNKCTNKDGEVDLINLIHLGYYDELENINCISDVQANELANYLRFYYKEGYDIIVHCVAGICRSGAVVEAAKLIGYEVMSNANYREPNILVYNKLRKYLGFNFSWE